MYGYHGGSILWRLTMAFSFLDFPVFDLEESHELYTSWSISLVAVSQNPRVNNPTILGRAGFKQAEHLQPSLHLGPAPHTPPFLMYRTEWHVLKSLLHLWYIPISLFPLHLKMYQFPRLITIDPVWTSPIFNTPVVEGYEGLDLIRDCFFAVQAFFFPC